MTRIQGGPQPDRIIARHRGPQEAQKERTRRQEGSQLTSPVEETKDSAQPSQHQQNKAQGPGTSEEVRVDLWLNPGRGQGNEHPERKNGQPYLSSPGGAARLYGARCLPDEIKCTVAGKHAQREDSHQHGVPIEYPWLRPRAEIRKQ